MTDGEEGAGVGFRAHAGWAAAVCIAGPVTSPSLLQRTRVLLTDGPLPCEPYHRAKGLDLEAAEEFVRQASLKAQTMASAWIQALAAEAQGRDCELAATGIILGSGRPEFSLKQALATHAATHNAEGWLYREALMRASEECGLRVAGAMDTSAYEQAAAAAGLPAARVEECVRDLGREAGPPWGKDQKLAAAVGWMALAQVERA